MDSREDISINQLFELYSLLQNVMKYHEVINEVVKNLPEKDIQPEDFESIEAASGAIIDACNQIESIVGDRKCHCCCQT